MDRTQLINFIQDALATADGALAEFRDSEDEHSDEANEDTIQAVQQLLDDAVAATDDLVP